MIHANMLLPIDGERAGTPGKFPTASFLIFASRKIRTLEMTSPVRSPPSPMAVDSSRESSIGYSPFRCWHCDMPLPEGLPPTHTLCPLCAFEAGIERLFCRECHYAFIVDPLYPDVVCNPCALVAATAEVERLIEIQRQREQDMLPPR